MEKGFFGRFDLHVLHLMGRVYVNKFNFDRGFEGDILKARDWVYSFAKSSEASKIKRRELHYFVGDLYCSTSTPSVPVLELFGLDEVSRGGDRLVHHFKVVNGKVVSLDHEGSRAFNVDTARILAAEYEQLTNKGYDEASSRAPNFPGIEEEFDFANPLGRERLRDLTKTKIGSPQ